MKTRLLKYTALFIFIASFNNYCLGQEYYDATNSPRQYYYNNLESATVNSPSTSLPGAGSSISSPSTINIVSSSSLNGTKSFSTVGSTSVGYVKFDFLGSSTTAGANISLANAAWEWEFDYKNTTGIAPHDPVQMVGGTDAWRYWLIANAYTGLNSTFGLYIALNGTSLVFRMQFSSASNGYQEAPIGLTIPANKDTYQIRIEKNAGTVGSYIVHLLDRTTGLKSTSNIINVGTSQSGVDLNTYNFSYMEATSAADDHFQWDNFNFYQVKLEYIPIIGSVNGITTAIYPGIVDAIPYAVNVNVRGDVNLGRFVINFTGNGSNGGQALFTSGALYKTSSAIMAKSTGTKLGDYSVNANNTNQLDLSLITIPEYYYSPGTTDGATINVINYFFVAQGRNPFYSGYSTTMSYSVSTSNSDNFQTFFQSTAPYNSSSTTSVSLPNPNGDVWDWTGTSTWGGTNANAWKKNTTLVTSAATPTANTDIVRIGVLPFTGTNQPKLSGAVTVGSIEIGKLGSTSSTAAAAITLDLNGQTLTVKNGMTVDAAANVKVDNTTSTATTVTINSGAISTMASTANLTLGNKVTVANSGTFTLLSDASGTASIAAIPTSSSFTGTYVVQRYFTGGSSSNRGWRLMSMPVNNSGTVGLATSATTTTAATYNFSSLQTNLLITGTTGTTGGFDRPSGYQAVGGPTVLFYNTASGLFTNLASITSNTSVGTGFYFYFRGNKTSNLTNKVIKSTAGVYATPEVNVVGLQSGTLNQKDFTYNLTPGTGYNLVGNPYPSTITVSSSALTGTTGFVYTYDPSQNSISPQTSATIASGQGFFVQSSNPTASSIAFTESMKATTQLVGGSTLLMGTPADNPEPTISLKMVQDTSNSDMTQLRFMDNYSKNYNQNEDANDLNANGQTVFFGAMTADNHQVAIASQPLDKERTSVYLSINDNNSGIFTINKVNLAGIPAIYDVWLMDHFNGDSLDLRSNSTYSFNIDKKNNATYGNSRLEVVIRKKILPPYQLRSFAGQKVNTNNVLRWSTSNEYDYTSFELQRSTDGKTFEPIGYVQSSSVGNYNFNDESFQSDTYYRLKQTDINNTVTYSAVILIANDSKIFSIYPNPTSNTLQFSVNQDTIKNALKLNIYNSMGILMRSGIFNSSTGQQDVSALAPGNYEVELIDNGTKKQISTAKFIKL